MDLEDIVVFIPFFLFLLFSLFGKFFGKKQEEQRKSKPAEKNSSLQDSIMGHNSQVPRERKARSHLKDVPESRVDHQKDLRKRKSLLDDNKFSFEDRITERSIDSSVGQRHVESTLEGSNFKGLLQERFSGESITFAKGRSRAAKLLQNQKSLKKAIILTEILEKKF